MGDIKVDLSGFDEFTKEINKINRKIKSFSKKEIEVGILKEQASDTYEDSGETLGYVASINEFGNKEQNIPQRSFIRSTFDETLDDTYLLLDDIVNSILENTNTTKFINKIGSSLKFKIINKIKTGPFVPNSPATIKIKGSNKPLIDTGKLIKSIDFKVI